MKFTIALIFTCLSTFAVYAETYKYSCQVCVFPTIVDANDYSDGCEEVDGKAYPLRVDDNKKILEWRGRKYKLTDAEFDDKPGCAKGGWHAEGNGTSFTFCYATQGYGAIEDKDGTVRVRCNLKRR